MELSIYKHKKEHPFRFWLLKNWMKLGLPITRSIKHKVANEIHAEIIIRLLDAIVTDKNVVYEKVLKMHNNLGKEIGIQLKDLLSVDENDAASISKIMDFIHESMIVKGKTALGSSSEIAISTWSKCSLYEQIHQNKNGVEYCNLQQEIYKGILLSINPKAKAYQVIRNENCDHCELKTWIE